MLVAHTEQEMQIKAADAKREAIYFCPSCREQVILKRGRRTIAHFAHHAHSLCRPFSESETQAHLTGKWQIATYFGTGEVELEPYLKQIAQRPDLLLRRKHHSLAIEYQCSPISAIKLQDRNLGYQKAGLDVVWILGEQYLAKMKRVRQAEKWLRYSKKLGWYLLFWQTDQQQLVVWHHLTLSAMGELQGYVKTSHNGYFAQLKPVSVKVIKQQIQTQVQAGLHYKTPKWLRLQQFCYEHGSLLQDMPLVCYHFNGAEPLNCEAPVLWCFLMVVLLRSQRLGSLVRQLDFEKWAAKISIYFEGAQLIQCSTQQVIDSWGRQLEQFALLMQQHGILKRLDQKAWQLVAIP
ncbi:competence protein CoiA [Secundilactobacillus folii]|uniref:Competence protein CoiA n=1 Tax=Secundilactobacillus folii TaxID=2678357 RepID=A0A7X3C3J7_9LACO|nr:competence protein CoiA family protein [Secundilactobacillus folii]MTV82932.1 hypothetical protein [Secundilactobacillus folii]